jgi:predicted dehydrogenase
LQSASRIRFAVIGIRHGHIYAMTDALVRGGGELASFHEGSEEWAAEYARRYPHARRAADRREILEDPSVSLVLGVGVPSDRAEVGLAVMRHGKDYLADKAAFLNLDDLAEARRVQKETGRIYGISYSERLLEPASWRAGEMVRSGAIGRVLHTAILAPHALRLPTREPWFFERRHYGGILTDIGSHQIEQFLYYSGVAPGEAEVVSVQVANHLYPQHPEFEDYGEATLRGRTPSGEPCTGYVRVDWLIPEGAKHSGRHRALLGTDGVLEMEYAALTLTTKAGTERIDCSDPPSEFGRLFVDDVLNRTETALGQEHCFCASELTLCAQSAATRL